MTELTQTEEAKPVQTPVSEQKHFITGTIEKAKDLGEGQMDVIVATESVDRDNEKLLMKGLDTKSYMSNPVVLWAHDYGSPPIGKALKLTKSSEGELRARMQFAIDENPFAHMIYKLWKGGFGAAFSIGFIPKEVEDNTYTKAEMIEFSAVPVPANPEALAQIKTAKAKGVINEKELVLAKKEVLDGEAEEEGTDGDEEASKPADETVEKNHRQRGVTPDLKVLETGITMLEAATERARKEYQELIRLHNAQAAAGKARPTRRSIRIRLVNVGSATKMAQSVSQSLNREVSRAGAVKPHAKHRKRIKRLKLISKEV